MNPKAWRVEVRWFPPGTNPEESGTRRRYDPDREASPDPEGEEQWLFLSRHEDFQYAFDIAMGCHNKKHLGREIYEARVIEETL